MTAWDGSPVTIKVSGVDVRADKDTIAQVVNIVADLTKRYPLVITHDDMARWMRVDPAWCRALREYYKFDLRSSLPRRRR